MRQRTSLARVLLPVPELLLLDEPFSNMDVESARQMVELLAGFRQSNRTIVLTTHQRELAAPIADWVLALHAGRVASFEPGSADAMKTNGARFLESLGIPSNCANTRSIPNDLSAITVAKKIGMPAEQVFKTLLTTDGHRRLCLRRHSRRRRARLQETRPRRRPAQGRDGSAQRRAAAHRLHSRRRHDLRRKESLPGLRR